MAQQSPCKDLNFGQKILYWLLLGVCKLIGLLPYVVLYYMLAPIIYFILYWVLRYRVKVVRTNLANSFPEKSEEERWEIERKFYKHLSEIFVDVIDMTSITPRTLKRRMHIENLEEFDREVGTKDWVAALAHYGEWEYFSVFAIDHPYHNLGVYHPLKSMVFDAFMILYRMKQKNDIRWCAGGAPPAVIYSNIPRWSITFPSFTSRSPWSRAFTTKAWPTGVSAKFTAEFISLIFTKTSSLRRNALSTFCTWRRRPDTR